MSQEILDQFSDVVVVNADHIALQISLDLKARHLNDQRKAFAGEARSGFFYLHRMDKFPDIVFECVMSISGDAVTSLYRNHSIFNTPGELTKARGLLLRAVAGKVGLSVEAVEIQDDARGRGLGLEELATGQLIDMLAERTGKSIVVTNSHVTTELAGV